MQARWLKYSHSCGSTWDVEKRGEEHVEKARKAFLARSGVPEAVTTTQKPVKKDYSGLFGGPR
jgi:predicted GIY-YIG superfamily endonuclease